MNKNELLVADVDTTGALRDAAEKVAGSETRAGFLAKGALATGGVVAGSGLFAGVASAQSLSNLSADDIHILNFALLLEYLEAEFYADAQARGLVTSQPAKSFAGTAGSHEATHVEAISAVISGGGGTPIARPTFDFTKGVVDEASFLQVAITLEDTGVTAYKGKAPLIKNKGLLATALTIHSIEARHAAWVRFIAGASPVIKSADPAATEQDVLAAVGQTGFITSPLPQF